MPKQVLTRRRSWTARIAVLAVVFSLLAVALPASAHSVAISTTVSCPASTPNAGFTDIGAFGADVQLAVNCIAAFGITTGTTATTYSPNGTVLRWQMALFLVRQAADHGITIPAAANQGYTDIAGLPQATIDAINQVTQLGISKGTTTTTFSPNDVVTRWQMALFLRRLAGLAGVTVTDDPAHNQFSDIAAFSAEIQAAVNFLADGHIALGTGGSLFSPNDPVFRWAMALFLTRVLAADGVAQPQALVNVDPDASASLATGQARTYTATFKNSDNSVYTGRIGIQLVEASSGAPVYNDTADNIVIEALTDSLGGVGTATAVGVAGLDGMVTFTIRHNGGAGEDTIPVVWEDLDIDGTYESVGNVAPTEPFGLGSVTDFVAGPQAEAPAGAFVGVVVTETTKASDVFEATGAPCAVVGGCSYFYDSGDIFTVDGAAATLQVFEDALSVNDTVSGSYAPATADQSTFDLTNVAATLAVTDPPAAGVTVDATSYPIVGTGAPGATINIGLDTNNDGDAGDPGEGTVASGVVDVDGNWTVTTPLVQNAANNFVATQVSPAAGPVDVPTITEAASAGATITASGVVGVPDGDGVIDAGDVIRINFSESLSGVSNGDMITLTDPDGTTGTITFGTNASFDASVAGQLDVTITAAIPVAGGSGGVGTPATINSISGFTDDDGEAINVTGSGAARTFAH
ncbi:MAG: S-layer homology domain-containing protein [Acidimicrobiia bacterium]